MPSSVAPVQRPQSAPGTVIPVPQACQDSRPHGPWASTSRRPGGMTGVPPDGGRGTQSTPVERTSSLVPVRCTSEACNPEMNDRSAACCIHDDGPDSTVGTWRIPRPRVSCWRRTAGTRSSHHYRPTQYSEGVRDWTMETAMTGSSTRRRWRSSRSSDTPMDEGSVGPDASG